MNINNIVIGLKNFKFENSYKKNNNQKIIIGGGIYTSETSVDSEYLKPSKNNVADSDTSFDTVANLSVESIYLKPLNNNIAANDIVFDTITDINTNNNNETSIFSVPDITVSNTSINAEDSETSIFSVPDITVSNTSINAEDSETSIFSVPDITVSNTSINAEDSETSVDSTYLKQYQTNLTISDTSVDTNNTDVQTVNNANFAEDILYNTESDIIEDKVLKTKYSIQPESVEKLLKLI
jgi:hypothetical protein